MTKASPLQLAVEFCGKTSFSLRHNEEKYNDLAEQLVSATYKALKDRYSLFLLLGQVQESMRGMRSHVCMARMLCIDTYVYTYVCMHAYVRAYALYT